MKNRICLRFLTATVAEATAQVTNKGYTRRARCGCAPRVCHFLQGINGQSCRPLIFRLLVPLVATLQALAIVDNAVINNAPGGATSGTACQSAKERAQNASHGGSYSRKECRTYCGTRACTYLKACCPSDSARRTANPCGAISFSTLLDWHLGHSGVRFPVRWVLVNDFAFMRIPP